MESLHLEKSQIYNLRAGAVKKLLRLRYGAGEWELLICVSYDSSMYKKVKEKDIHWNPIYYISQYYRPLHIFMRIKGW